MSWNWSLLMNAYDMNDLGEWWPLDTMNINSDATAPVESTRNEDQGSTHVIEHAPLVDASAWSTFDYGSVPAYPARGLRSDLRAQSTSSYGINTRLRPSLGPTSSADDRLPQRASTVEHAFPIPTPPTTAGSL
ncbi:SubName: Full=Uncharacterized protein {ECO:0000313/EMBL:CCA70625.1} [Serendipita indica DSM 11827]|nr:SubName: Full=Uncharacterized protein {ECO:0000313/EMBL:CCA70625.1} [Serendipita indica DSM 11827]